MTQSGWRDRWIAWRNRRLADPAFQRWALDFPLTRPIARRRARDLFDLVSGFVYSQTLVACLRLNLLDRLSTQALDTAGVAEATGLPADAALRLLRACAALDLVEGLGGDRWALGPQGAALLGNAGLGQMILHHEHLYADLADSVGLLRGKGEPGELARYWPYAGSAQPGSIDAAAAGAYSRLMAATQPTVAADVLAAYPMARHRRLLDVGGGQGVFLAAAGRSAPALRLMLFDLPAVARTAAERLGAAGMLERAELVGGDFLADPLPLGADIITLIRILHDHDDEGVTRLLAAARSALPPDGTLLVAEPMSAAPRADRIADVYFAFYLQAMGRGQARTPDRLFEMLRAAGFRRMRLLRTRAPFLLRAIVAHP